ncbi:MAG: serine/threonine protein kinase [Nocardioides sp.]|nr:serine/threonine protein kinase [Nocardioides sp.]
MTERPGESSDSAWRPPARTQPATESLAGYDELVEIGRGGDSVVYRARDRALSREVAIKVLLTNDAASAARFARELQITVDLGRQHPNIVTVLATGTTESGRPAIVMDYYEAGSLHDRVKALGPMPADDVVVVGTILADALSFAHDRGVLHRDVKPQNILVLPTSWVLADFGIARLADSDHTASVETFTYRHAAPQILDGYPPSPADDIWSLGSTLYTLVDGRPPFASEDPDDDSALAYLRRARTEPHRPLLVPGAERLAPVIDRCLAKDVESRWQSAAELRDALAALRVTAWEPGHGGGAPAGPGVAAPRPVDQVPPPVLEPVALSVLAHAPSQVRDAEPTGLRPHEAPAPEGIPLGDGAGAAPPAGPEPEAEAESDENGGRRRIVLILGVTALVVGLTLGIAGALLRNGDDKEPGAATPTVPQGHPIPTLSTSPTQSGDPQLPRGNPKLAFDFLRLDSDGTALTLKWNDPTDGKGTFALTRTTPSWEPVWTFRLGATQDVIPIAVPPGRRTCFVMTVSMPSGDLGLGEPVRCVH